MENRGALRFVVGTLSRKPYQRGQGAKPRHAARGQPRCYRTADRGHNPAAKPDLPRRAVPTPAHQARCPESYHGHGTPPRPTRLSNVEVRSTVPRQRRCVLRAEKPPSTNSIPQKEGSPTRPTGHSSPSLTLSTNKFLGRNFAVGVATIPKRT